MTDYQPGGGAVGKISAREGEKKFALNENKILNKDSGRVSNFLFNFRKV